MLSVHLDELIGVQLRMRFPEFVDVASLSIEVAARLPSCFFFWVPYPLCEVESPLGQPPSLDDSKLKKLQAEEETVTLCGNRLTNVW